MNLFILVLLLLLSIFILVLLILWQTLPLNDLTIIFQVYFSILCIAVQKFIDEGQNEPIDVLFLYSALQTLLQELPVHLSLNIHQSVGDYQR